MSFRSLLKHRCDIYDLLTRDDDGSPRTEYVKINDKPIRCRLDLNFIRQGRDSRWVDTAARPQDRAGTLFIEPSIRIKSGMRVRMVRGPHGMFNLMGAIDEAWDEATLHHYEVGVVEVSSLQYRADVIQEPGTNPLENIRGL